MSERITFEDILKGNKAGRPPRGSDPRLIALVRFLARRAAERDYERLRKKAAAGKKRLNETDI